jgi:hypothetical protein
LGAAAAAATRSRTLRSAVELRGFGSSEEEPGDLRLAKAEGTKQVGGGVKNIQ